MKPNPDTIAAIATSGGKGGIGIIKISGLNAFAVAKNIFRPINRYQESTTHTRPVHPDKRLSPFEFESHRIYYGHIIEPETGALLDEVLLSAMKAPQRSSMVSKPRGRSGPNGTPQACPAASTSTA